LLPSSAAAAAMKTQKGGGCTRNHSKPDVSTQTRLQQSPSHLGFCNYLLTFTPTRVPAMFIVNDPNDDEKDAARQTIGRPPQDAKYHI
jgi:hypothetical protein